MMSAIPFTQFMRPSGRPVSVSVNRPNDIAEKAMTIIDRGYRFECEQLADGHVSLTISNDDGDFEIELVGNGPDVPIAVDRLIDRGVRRLSEGPRS